MTPRLIAALMCVPIPAGALMADPVPLDASFLRTYAETRGFMLGRPVKPKFTPDGKTVLFLRSEVKNPRLKLFAFDVATKTTTELLSPEVVLKGAAENLSPEEKARRERMRQSAGGFADYHLTEDGSKILLPLSGNLYLYDRATKGVTELATGPGPIFDPKFSPDGSKIAYVRGYDLYVFDLAAGKESAVTAGGTVRKSHGLAEFVAQEEMRRYSGYWWSPDAKFIAYEETDAEGVETWYVADPVHPENPPLEQFYPRPGKKNVGVRLGIVPVTGGETVWVEWDRKAFEYMAQVRWDKHGPLTVLVQDRKQQHQQLLRVDPSTGKSTVLLEERDPAWLNLHDNVPHWLDEGKSFVWVAEGKQGPRLEVRDAEGKAIWVSGQSNGSFPELITVDEKRRLAYLTESSHPSMRSVVVADLSRASASACHDSRWRR